LVVYQAVVVPLKARREEALHCGPVDAVRVERSTQPALEVEQGVEVIAPLLDPGTQLGEFFIFTTSISEDHHR
jgi:hypothetical protein